MSNDSPQIQIRGARVHNLKNIDLDIPHGQLVVLTGPSGSGKSSLAFDTLFAEGQRQYLETLSAQVRQHLHQFSRPDVDSIDGLQPTICVDQRRAPPNPRATVATVTEVYDFLRLLMARLGDVHCYRCGAPIASQPPEEIQKRLLALPEGSKLMLLAPLVRGRKSGHNDAIARIRKAGFVRVRIDGTIYDIEGLPALTAQQPRTIEAVVDRIVVRPSAEARLAESLRLTLEHGQGVATAVHQAPGEGPQWTDTLFSTIHACPNCQISYEEIEPRTFSFNSPHGACDACEGLGRSIQFDAAQVLPDASLSLAEGALAPYRGMKAAAIKKLKKSLQGFLESVGANWETPLDQLDQSEHTKLLHGDGETFLGVLLMLEKELSTAVDTDRRDELEAYRTSAPCPECQGARLRTEARHVYVQGKAIHDITAVPIAETAEFFDGLSFDDDRRPIADPIVGEIRRRLAFLNEVGLSYLTLDRGADTLSGGEMQRVRLATGIGSGLSGVCYILDEPTIGLHPRDNLRLIEAFRRLKSQENSVLVVEHDEAMMRQADLLIDIGPGAGLGGGNVVACGTVEEVSQQETSPTGAFLSGRRRIDPPSRRRSIDPARQLVIEGAAANNLKSVDVVFPLGTLICVTGVSGSGKSSLVSHTLAPALRRGLGLASPPPGEHSKLVGLEHIDKVIVIDQRPIGRSPRSNAATYLGAFDEIRKLFAATRQAKRLGFRASRFSFNAKGGRCETCRGQGVRKIEMSFLPELSVVCESCGGSRFNRQTLSIRFGGKNIAEVLELSAGEAVEFFDGFAKIREPIQSLCDVGLGYLPLGQPATTLSGGEAQRIKLAGQLSQPETGQTFYILDEPTTGLHPADIEILLSVLHRLVERGNTMLVIEHNLDVIKCADWIVDLGPEGGDAGGRVVALGTPESIAEVEASHTGRHLRSQLVCEDTAGRSDN